MNIEVLAFSIMAGTPKGNQSNYWDPNIWNPQEKSGRDEKAKAGEDAFKF